MIAAQSLSERTRRIGALTWRQLWQTISYLGPNVVKLLRPAGYLLLSVGIGGSIGPVAYRGIAMRYIDFLLPGLLATLAFDAFGETLFRAANEKQWGVYRLTAMHGVNPAEYTLSHLVYGLAWYAAKAAALMLLALVFGARAQVGTMLISLLWGCVGVITWVSCGLAVGIRVDSYYYRDMLSTLVAFPVIFASSAFYDLARAPLILRWVAGINPLSLLATTMRDAALAVTPPPGRVVALIACCIVAMLTAVALIRRTPLIAQDR